MFEVCSAPDVLQVPRGLEFYLFARRFGSWLIAFLAVIQGVSKMLLLEIG